MRRASGPPYRILHVLDSFGLGGAQQVVLDLLKHHNRELYAPEVACLYGTGVFWADYQALGIPVHSLSPSPFLPVYIPRLYRLYDGSRASYGIPTRKDVRVVRLKGEGIHIHGPPV